MISKLKYTLLTMLLAAFVAQPALASPLNNDDMAFAFGDTSSVSSDLGEMALLSHQEMMETEGQALWFAPIAVQFGRFAAIRIAHHSAHHTFRWGLGRLPHLQMNYWRPGISGSGGAIRIPLPNRPFFTP